MNLTIIENTCHSHSRQVEEIGEDGPPIQSMQSFVEALRSAPDAEEGCESPGKTIESPYQLGKHVLPGLRLQIVQTDRPRLSASVLPEALSPQTSEYSSQYFSAYSSDVSPSSYDNLSVPTTTVGTRTHRRTTLKPDTQEKVFNPLLMRPWARSANCMFRLESIVEETSSSSVYPNTLLSQQEADLFFQDAESGPSYLPEQASNPELQSVQENVHRYSQETFSRVRARQLTDPISVSSSGWLSRQDTDSNTFQATEPVATNNPKSSFGSNFRGGHKHFPRSRRQLPGDRSFQGGHKHFPRSNRKLTGDRSFQPTDGLRQVTTGQGTQKQITRGTYASIFTEELKLDTTQGTHTPALLRRIESADEENKEDILERHLNKIFAAIRQDIPKPKAEPQAEAEPNASRQAAKPSRGNSRCGAKWVWGKVWARFDRRNGKFWTSLRSERQSRTLGARNTRLGV